MDYKDVQREARKFWRQLKARCTAGLFTKISFFVFSFCLFCFHDNIQSINDDIARGKTVLNQFVDELQAPIGDKGNKNEQY